MKVLNPRPKDQAAELSQLIQAAGGVAVEFPSLEIQALSNDWYPRLPALSTIDKAIFVSVNAVKYFFSELQIHQCLWPSSIQTFAIGKATAAALKQFQVKDIHIPIHADSETLLALSDLQNVLQQTVLVVAGKKTRPLLTTTLRDRGANVDLVAVYKRALPKKNRQLAQTLWQDDAVDIILGLSQEAMTNLFALFGPNAKSWLQSKPWVVISPRLVDMAHHHHIRTVILSSYSNIINTLVRYGMSMDDEKPNNHSAPSSSEVEEKKPIEVTPTPQPLSLKNTFVIGFLAIIVGSLATLGVQYVSSSSSKPVTSVSTKSDTHWKDIQNQIQALHQSQQQTADQVSTQQHQIQSLLQNQTSKSQHQDIQKAQYYLDLAQINAEWSSNGNASTQLLLAADQILANSTHPNLSAIRQAIREDLQALEQIPTIDTKSLLAKLSALDQKIEQYSIRTQTLSAQTTQLNKESTWRDNLQNNMQQLRGLISIHYQDTTSLEPFNPDYLALLRENMRMNIQQAELAVIEQHQDLYNLALASVYKNLETGFNPNNPKTQALLQEVQALQKMMVAYQLPKLHSYAPLFADYAPANAEDPS